MSGLHYFQRYDSKENWVTNATLLLLSRLYHYNRLKFETSINAILADSNLSLNVGVKFTQQQWGQNSVVDGVISQDSFKVVVETKLYDNFSTDQLIRHLDALGADYSQRILLALSKSRIDSNIRTEIIKTLQQDKYKDIKFASTTYEDIYQIISHNLADFDLEMKEILDDYISLCNQHGLTNIEDRTMLAFTASESLNENFKYSIYYDPVTRSHNSLFKYIGLYLNKAVVAVGRLEKIVYCDYQNGNLVATNGDDLTRLTKDEYNRIKETIENTDYYDLEHGNKFFLVNNFYKTNYIKTSFSSIRAKKYFWLDEIEGFKDGMTAEQIAKLLDGKTWE
ncbi:MAG TPA: hypothetical protein VK483_01770 [Chitinophagaceae bacterium]|nr:hypothetical protein [Chitinophagaceae bacterium]